MSRVQEKSKNDKAWEILFERFNILDEIHMQGYFEISSTEINKVRESRLMAKFDHYVNLPKIFRDNKLSILPISRSKYKIGYFDIHHKVSYLQDEENRAFSFPEEIESLDYANLYSESSSLNCAFNAGIIDDLAGDKVFHTISGRMSTDKFEFKVKSSIDSSATYDINVDSSQCEIDGGFESQDCLLLVEVKNYSVEDFLVRQLYFPYRLWSSKITKKVIPVLMTYSNDVFSFFLYEFKNELNYNSISLIEQRNYVIAPEQIQSDDIIKVLEIATPISEPDNVPFPQADKFERVIDLLSLLVDRDLTKEDITENYQFNIRQTQYYTDAGRYLGLIDKYSDPTTNEITFCLTKEGKKLFKKRHKAKFLSLIEQILKHQVFYRSFKLALEDGAIPSKDRICQIMVESDLSINATTASRRSSTVRGWIEWIWSQID